MNEKTNGQNKGHLKELYIIGGIAITILAIWLVPILIEDAQKSSDPWWKNGEIDRLEVRTCENTSCSKYQSNVYEVLYNGRVSKNYTRDDNISADGARQLSSLASKGLSWVDEDALDSWRKEVGMSGTKSIKNVDTIDGFQILKQSDHKNAIETYGFCYQNHGDKSCIAFSSSTQYRFKP